MLGKRKGAARIIVLSCLTVLTAFAGLAQANVGGCGGEPDGQYQRHDYKRFSKKLGLSETQKSQAKAIFQENRETVKSLLSSLRTGQENLRTLMHADSVDEAAIRAETARIAAIRADLNVSRAKAGVQFRALLTPAQLAILKTGPAHKHKGEHAADPNVEY